MEPWQVESGQWRLRSQAERPFFQLFWARMSKSIIEYCIIHMYIQVYIHIYIKVYWVFPRILGNTLGSAHAYETKEPWWRLWGILTHYMTQLSKRQWHIAIIDFGHPLVSTISVDFKRTDVEPMPTQSLSLWTCLVPSHHTPREVWRNHRSYGVVWRGNQTRRMRPRTSGGVSERFWHITWLSFLKDNDISL